MSVSVGGIRSPFSNLESSAWSIPVFICNASCVSFFVFSRFSTIIIWRGYMKPIQYMTSLLTFYLKGESRQEQNFVNLKKPNTILSLIPLGAKKDSIPVSQLALVESNFKLHFGSLILGAIIFIVGLSLISESFFAALILMLVGANKAITAFETVLTVKTTAGDIKNVSFLIFEKSKSNLAERQIRQIISERLDDTNNRVQTDRIVEAINNK